MRILWIVDGAVMMQRLFTPAHVIDPAEKPIVLEVCDALEEWSAAGDDPGALAYLAARNFGKKWHTAIRNLDPESECRERLDRAVDKLARLDAVFVDKLGRLWNSSEIYAAGGKVDTRTNRETGEVYRAVMFPYVDHTGAFIFQVSRDPE